jgi:hypothetical protein
VRLREQDLAGFHLVAGRKSGGRVMEVTGTREGRRGGYLYEGRLLDAATAATLQRAPYRSRRRGVLRRWWQGETRGALVPDELLEGGP